MSSRRLIRPPARPGWPVAVELREHGGPVALMQDGQRRDFVLESDLLAAWSRVVDWWARWRG